MEKILKKICEICKKEEEIDSDDSIYFLELNSINLGRNDGSIAEEVLLDGCMQTQTICEECIKKLGFKFTKKEVTL